jgi:hypothetical protein
MPIFPQCGERISITKKTTTCKSINSALVNLGLFVVATVLATGNIIQV